MLVGESPKSLTEKCKNFPKNQEFPQNSKCQKDYKKQSKNIRCHCTIWLPTQDLCSPVICASGHTSSNRLSVSWTPVHPWMLSIYYSVCYAIQYPVFIDTNNGSHSCVYWRYCRWCSKYNSSTSCDNFPIQQLLDWGNVVDKILYFIFGWVRPRILQISWGIMEDKEDHECQILGLQVRFNLMNKVPVPNQEYLLCHPSLPIRPPKHCKMALLLALLGLWT